MDEHADIRESFAWGTYGVNGDEPIRYILLRNIHDDHLQNIINMFIRLDHNPDRPSFKLMLTEQEYRRIHRIRVPFKFDH